MTTDLIALTHTMPDVWSLVAALMSGGPEPLVGVESERALIRLVDAEGRPLVFVEAPFPVHTPGEVERLLGIAADGPVWWTEVRAATSVRNAEALAGTIATRLVSLLGGSVWPPGAAAPDGGLGVVADIGPAAAQAAEQPAVDVLTDKVAAVIQDRPTVALTTWLADALRAAAASRRAFQLITSADARLTLPTRGALSGLPNRWVVRDGEGGYYDGLSGNELRWRDGSFQPLGRIARPFAEATAQADGTAERQLLLTCVTRQAATDTLLLGGAVEALWRVLAGTAPTGWGTSEPAGMPWSREELTGVARARAPRPSGFVVVGAPGDRALATLRTTRTESGVEEHVTFALGCPAGVDPPLGALHALADELVADHGLVSLLVQRRSARSDLTVPAHLEAAPAPEAFVLGPDAVRDTGFASAARPPTGVRPTRVGRKPRQGLWYPLRDEGWEGFQNLVSRLRPDEPARGHRES
ncbi:DUF6177 family protein [Yinghuangia sp. ASG 101]|uniref:DUF6177 family protein n=1 Tax=Yinghuangia sp. ASG 101 TaxID=2896848 RepID=UPI001E40F4F5|nr:DUF6177 family protein [Yinghuangia sp. ASG 101]UGQ15042.1 DUF6177 family protein [Yinghuangia sp. ASG 101]